MVMGSGFRGQGVELKILGILEEKEKYLEKLRLIEKKAVLLQTERKIL